MAYAGELNLRVDEHNLRTADSWIQPVILRQSAGDFGWTAAGPIWFTKSSGKWPGAYWESGAILNGMWVLPTAEYHSPYISGGKIVLVWRLIVGIAEEKSTFNKANSDVDEIGIVTVKFGEPNTNVTTTTVGNGKNSLLDVKNLNFAAKYNQNKSFLGS